jgi:hypothetical protein
MLVLQELWNEDTGELLCRHRALYGTGLNAMDELDYVVGVPPCMWGLAPDDRLSPPPRLRLDTRLKAVQISNSTVYHRGVMNQWQIRGAWE